MNIQKFRNIYSEFSDEVIFTDDRINYLSEEAEIIYLPMLNENDDIYEKSLFLAIAHLIKISPSRENQVSNSTLEQVLESKSGDITSIEVDLIKLKFSSSSSGTSTSYSSSSNDFLEKDLQATVYGRKLFLLIQPYYLAVAVGHSSWGSLI